MHKAKSPKLRNLLAPSFHRKALGLIPFPFPFKLAKFSLKFVAWLIVATYIGTAALIVLLAYWLYNCGVTQNSSANSSRGQSPLGATQSAGVEHAKLEPPIEQVANQDVIEALEQEIGVLSKQYEELNEEARVLRNTSAQLAKAQKKATKLEAQAARINTRRMKLNEQLLKRLERQF